MASSLKTIAQAQSRISILSTDSVANQRQSYELSNEVKDLHRLATEIAAARFQLDILPLAKTIRDLVSLIPSDLGRQEAVEQANRILDLMDTTNMRQPRP